MALKKIEQSDLVNKGVIGLPDTPALSTSDMQKKFEETARDVVIPHFNKLVDTLESPTGASNIGVSTPQGYEANPNVQAVLDAIAKTSNENKADRHSHSNKSVLDTITDLIKKGYDRLVTLFEGIKNVSNTVTNSTEEIPTSKAIVDYVKELGGGDMLRSEYDTNKNGVVDDSEKLGGKFPGEYAKTADFEKYKESVSVEFSKINSNITYTVTFSPDTSGSVFVYQIGKILFIYINVRRTTALPKGGKLFHINDCPPLKSTEWQMLCDVINFKTTIVNINTNGNVEGWDNFPTNVNVCGFICSIIAD